MKMRTIIPGIVVLAALPFVAPLPGLSGPAVFGAGLAAAQQTPPQALQSARARGWLGVELAHEGPSERAGAPERIRIVSVVPGSPSERAGLRAGDVIVEVGGERASSAVLERFAARLEPGADVRIAVDRGGERRVFDVRAGERPIVMTPSGALLSPDSVGARIRLHIDSMRLGLEAAEVRALTSRQAIEEAVRLGGARGPDTLRVVRLRDAPGEPFLLRGSVQTLPGPRIQVDTLVAVIRSGPGSPGEPRVVTIRRDAVAFDTLRARPGEVSVLRGPVRSGEPPLAIVEGGVRTDVAARARSNVQVTPRAVTVLAQRAVAGAELMPLNPGLATYFGVDEGVLTVEVIEGTPAHDAGLRPGDVIVEVDGEAVTDVAGVRAALARGLSSPPVPVRIVREGAFRTLQLSR